MMKAKGFTLIELMVSIVLYGIIMVSVLASFWNLVSIRERADHFRNLERELHFAMSRVSDAIRGYSVDYDSSRTGFGGITQFTPGAEHPKLMVYQSPKIDPLFGTTIIEPLPIEFINTASRVPNPYRNIWPDVNSGIHGLEGQNILFGGQPLFSRKVQLDLALPNYFKVHPQEDPFQGLGDPDLQIQPRVEIFMSVQDVDFPDLRLSVKTTVSSRRYSQ